MAVLRFQSSHVEGNGHIVRFRLQGDAYGQSGVLRIEQRKA